MRSSVLATEEIKNAIAAEAAKLETSAAMSVLAKVASTGLAEKATFCAGFREFGTSDHGPLQAVFDVPAPTYEPAPEPTPAAPSPAQARPCAFPSSPAPS